MKVEDTVAARFVTEPVVTCIAEMGMNSCGVAGMIDWVESRAPQCLPGGYADGHGDDVKAAMLFPHDLMRDGGLDGLSENELLVELAGRTCYNSFGLKAGRKSNAEYIAHTQAGDVPHACYDETTEVLTASGWKAWPDVTSDDLLATRSAEGVLEYHRPNALTTHEYEGPMYSVESPMVDLLVTPNHRMYVCPTTTLEGRRRERFEFVEASALDQRSHCYVKDALWDSGERRNLAVMKLLGFAIGDGYIPDRTPGVLRFHLRRERKIVWLRNVCREAGLELRERGSDEYSLLLGEGRALFSRIYDSDGQKVIPQDLLASSDRPSLEALWEGLLNSDGHQGATAVLYSSRSPRLLDQVQQLLLHIGQAGHVHSESLISEGECPYVTMIRRNLRPEFNRGATLPRTKWIEWGGKVYCAQVPNGTLYVRRNGIPVWCGNSILYHAKMSFFIAGVSRRVSHELIRNYVGADRDEEGSPSQQSTRYVENAGFYIVPPRYLEDAGARQQFERACHENYSAYRRMVAEEIRLHGARHGAPPKGMDYKRILEAASALLMHSVETSFVWTTNPMALAKLFRERDHDAADLEFRRFAKAWKALCLSRWPNLFPQPWMKG